jgi:uncharacterized membrane protein YqaE (UPF0057 family)
MLKSLKHGHSLPYSEAWKVLQILLNLAGLWLPVAALFSPPLQSLLDVGLVTKLTAALATTNAYLTLATSPKIGV